MEIVDIHDFSCRTKTRDFLFTCPVCGLQLNSVDYKGVQYWERACRDHLKKHRDRDEGYVIKDGVRYYTGWGFSIGVTNAFVFLKKCDAERMLKQLKKMVGWDSIYIESLL